MLAAADYVEKVRINPGNYADSRTFAVREYIDEQYAAEIARIEERVIPLIVARALAAMLPESLLQGGAERGVDGPTARPSWPALAAPPHAHHSSRRSACAARRSSRPMSRPSTAWWA